MPFIRFILSAIIILLAPLFQRHATVRGAACQTVPPSQTKLVYLPVAHHIVLPKWHVIKYLREIDETLSRFWAISVSW